MSELSDREVIQISAQVCGLEIAEQTFNGKSWFETPDARRWNPLEDARDAWKVLEAVREWEPRELRIFALILGDDPNGAESTAMILQAWFWNGHFSDIPRAAAAAYQSKVEA